MIIFRYLNYAKYLNVLCSSDDPNCGTWQLDLVQATGGQDAKRGQFPWHAALYGKLNNGSYLYICGGTLIKPNIVVTG